MLLSFYPSLKCISDLVFQSALLKKTSGENKSKNKFFPYLFIWKGGLSVKEDLNVIFFTGSLCKERLHKTSEWKGYLLMHDLQERALSLFRPSSTRLHIACKIVKVYLHTCLSLMFKTCTVMAVALQICKPPTQKLSRQTHDKATLPAAFQVLDLTGQYDHITNSAL